MMNPCTGFPSLVSVQEDASVLIQHTGCEIGQGLNTKAVQTAALELGDDRLGIDAGGRRGVLEAAPLAQQLHLWVKQLSYFLMHFPGDSDYDGGGIEPLRRLERSLCIRNHGQK